MKRAAVAFTGAILLIAVSATDSPGQSAAEGTGGPFCWRGRALPECGSFAIFELEAGFAILSTTVRRQAALLSGGFGAPSSRPG